MDKPDAIRLAEHLEEVWYQHKAAAELRRLHAENERLAAEVANRNRRALDGDEAVSALANVHAYYEGLEAQRDALLQALKLARESGCATVYANEDDECGERGCCGVVSYKPHADDCWVMAAQATIKAVEEGK